MTQHVENYCQRTELLLRMLEGDLAPYVSVSVKDEIKRVLRMYEDPNERVIAALMEADE